MRMTALFADLRYAARTLIKNPAFALATVLTLALGIGANTAIFTVVNAVLLRPLPFSDPQRLVRIWHAPPPEAFPGVKTFSVSPANFLDWQSQSRAFEQMAVYGGRRLNLSGGREPEVLRGAAVSSNFFSVLGRQPAIGRTFLPQEDQPGADRVAILSHDLWKTRFGADPSIVGQDVRLDGQACRVIGVMGPEFRFPSATAMWVPLAWDAQERAVRNNHNYLVVARLKPGADLRQARAEMTAISERLAQQYPEDDRGWGAVVLPLQEDLVSDVGPLLWILLGAVGCVLAIACANVANLLLGKALGRRKEIAVRSALGASRGRLIQQLLSETLLLSLAGGALGIALAGFGVDGIVAFLSQQLPLWIRVSADGRVFGFALAISTLTGVLAGLGPAWRQTRRDIAGSLKQGLGRGTADSGDHRMRGFLVVSEVALSLVLLIGAGLLIRSLRLLSRVDPGFDPGNAVTLTTFLARPRYEEPARQLAFARAAFDQLRALPGVEAVGAVNDLPPFGSGSWPIAVEGRPPLPVSQQPAVAGMIVAGDYFRALRIPLKRGRLLTQADDATAPPGVVVSESMARRFWPGEDPLGKRLTTVFFPDKTLHVVGVVGDVKQLGLERREPVSQMYLSFPQIPEPALQFVVRTSKPSRTVAREAVAALHRIDPDQPVTYVKTMEEVLSDSLVQQRFSVSLLTAFASLALALAAIGVYSVLSYAVRRRGREIGVRIALGARTGDVLRMVVAQGMRPALLGMAIGLCAAVALRGVLSSLLYGVSASDPTTFVAVVFALCLVALAACLVPALRATRIDPIESLRSE